MNKLDLDIDVKRIENEPFEEDSLSLVYGEGSFNNEFEFILDNIPIRLRPSEARRLAIFILTNLELR